MQNTTGRAFWRDEPAAPAAATSFLPAIASESSQLLTLEAQLIEALTEEDRLCAELDTAEEALPDWAKPGLPFLDSREHAVFQLMGDTIEMPLCELKEFNRRHERLVPIGGEDWRRRQTEGCERIAIWVNEMRRKQAEQERMGYTACEKALAVHCRRVHEIEKAILSTPAQSAADVAAKLRVMFQVAHGYDRLGLDHRFENDSLPLGEKFAFSALVDAERLAGTAAHARASAFGSSWRPAPVAGGSVPTRRYIADLSWASFI